MLFESTYTDKSIISWIFNTVIWISIISWIFNTVMWIFITLINSLNFIK
jgi:hypothetical protein